MEGFTWAAILVALAGGAGGFAGAAFSAWLNHRGHDKSRRHEQQRRDAEVLGMVLDYLVDSDPKRLAMNAPTDQARLNEEMQKLLDRRDQLRAGVMVLAAGHPDPAVRAQARDLSVALYNALSSAVWAVRDLHFQRDKSLLEVAIGDHEAAQKETEKLLGESHRYGSGR